MRELCHIEAVVQSAPRGAEGSRTYGSVRRKTTAESPRMNERLAHYLSAAGDFYPHLLQEQFPRIVEQIVSVWPYADKAIALFEDLLIDKRGGRQGFDPDVAREIFQLRVVYENIMAMPTKVEGDIWRHEQRAAHLALEELGMKVVPADLCRAAEHGDVKALGLLLRAGLDVDARDVRDWTPLMVAAFHGRETAAKLLIECGANPRARDRAGYTPLHWAALKGYTSVVTLLAKRADCNVRSAAGITPLLQAAASGHIDVVRTLLGAGADPNIAASEGWTPLHKAVANGHADVVRELLLAGASPAAEHADGTTPIRLALDRGAPEILQVFQEYASGELAPLPTSNS